MSHLLLCLHIITSDFSLLIITFDFSSSHPHTMSHDHICFFTYTSTQCHIFYSVYTSSHLFFHLHTSPQCHFYISVRPGAVARSEASSLGMQAAPNLIPTSGTFFRGDLVMKTFSTAFLPLQLIQEEQLSVTRERMCTKYW